MSDEGETTEEDSSGNKQEMKPESEINSDIKSVTKLDIHSDNNREIMHQEQQVKVTSSNSSVKTNTKNPVESGDNAIPGKNDKLKIEKSETKMKHDNLTRVNLPPRSSCKPRSRDPRRCQKHFREMIGLHEMKNEELGRREGDLRQRLEMLECSMPAVMVWNIWRMAQGASVPNVGQVLEKQFQDFAPGGAQCPSTPSQHYDCRVRQVEAERKQAQRRADEARALWSEKEFALGEQKRKLEEARQTQARHSQRIEKLKAQVEELRRLRQQEKEADGDSCETGECGEIKCKQWLGDVASTTSVKSTDLECLARLQDLAEAELCMKRDITELERREEAYMRTLQQADQLWSKMETDGPNATSALQEQLELKASANQQLADRVCSLEDIIENLNKKLANCKSELEKSQCTLSSRTVGISCRDETLDKCSSARKINVASKDQMTLGKCTSLKEMAVSCISETLDRCVSARKVNLASKDQMTLQRCTSSKQIATTSREKMLDRCLSAKRINVASKETMGKPTPSKEMGVSCKSDMMHRCVSAKKVNIASKDQMTDPDKDDDYVSCRDSENDSDSEGEPCGANFACNDQVFSPTGMENDESEPILEDLAKNLPVEAKESLTQLSKPPSENEKSSQMEKKQEDAERIESDDVSVPKVELKSWLETTTNVETTIAKCSKCSPSVNDLKTLSNSIRIYLQIPLEDIKEFETIKTPEILSEIEAKQSSELDVILKPRESFQSEVLESEGKIDKKSEESHAIIENSQENIKLSVEIVEQFDETEPTGKTQSDEKLKTDEQLELLEIVEPPNDKLESVAKIEPDELPHPEEKIEPSVEEISIENDKQLITDVEEKTDDETEAFTQKVEARDEEREKIHDQEEMSDLIPKDNSLHDQQEIQHITEDKVSSPSIENEDKLSKAGENDEFSEKSIILEKDEEEEEEEKVEKNPEKEISEEKSQIMTESSSSTPEEAEAVIVEGAVTSSAEEVVKELVKPEFEQEIPQLSREQGSKENSLETLAETDSDCVCKPEKKLPERKSTSIEPKITLREKKDESQESICVCPNEISKEKSKSAPKLIYYIIRRTICKRSDQDSLTSREETPDKIERSRKSSHIKVKDESIGTVVSVGQQTKKKIRKQQSPMGKIKKIHSEGSDYISVSSSVNLNNESTDTRNRGKNGKSSEFEFTCDVCKKFVSSNTVDNGSHIEATLTQKLIGFQSEINTCCSCKQQRNSNSKFQTEETIETHQVGKQFSRGKASAKPISRETVEDVTINSHVGVDKKFYTPPEKSDPRCLAKLIKNENDCRDKRQKSQVNSRSRNTGMSPKHFYEIEYKINNNNNNNSNFDVDLDCICEESNSPSGNKLTEREKQFKMEKNRTCHCDDSD